jgi:hypothetical protein
MTVLNDANTYLPGVIQIPSSLTITDITRSFPMIVTVSVNPINEANTYIIGQNVRLNVPATYKMIQANGLVGTIVAIGNNTLSLNIDSTLFDQFVTPAAGQIQPATVAPSGSRNLQFNNLTNQVPFQSLNNIGN